jgi:hypothetical protein
MGKPINFLLLAGIILLIFISNASSQDKSVLKNTTSQVNFSDELGFSSDYKIIASTDSYLEIEFFPQYTIPEKILYKNESFLRLAFENSKPNDLTKSGEPDAVSRVFAVILPAEEGNSVRILDYDVNEASGINLAPVPSLNRRDPNRRDFENDELVYEKNKTAYSQNTYLPIQIASLEKTGIVRDITLGNLVIYPFQYNPVSRTLKQYTRIHLRIEFGKFPVRINRKRSYEEISFLSSVALNSANSYNWMSPELIGQKDRAPINSVMTSGNWYKIEIKDIGDGMSTGIYKMNKSFLESAGINLTGVNPKTIKMYGNGGAMLPENMNTARPEDLVETAIYIEGEQDGSFDAQDYILFYGKSTNRWLPDEGPGGYKHFINYYSNSNYYWISINSSGFGKRMEIEQSINIQNPIIGEFFSERLFYEPEFTNPILEGNIWLSRSIHSGGSFVWNNTLTGLVSGSDIIYKIKPAVHVYSANYNYMHLKEDFSNVSPIIFQLGYSTPNYGNWIWTGETSFTINQTQMTNGEQSRFSAAYFCSNPEAEGYFDWMEIHYKRRFNSVKNDYLHFYSSGEQGVTEYNISPFLNNQIRIFDVTEHNTVKMIQPLNTGANNVKFQRLNGLVSSEYFVTGQNAYKTPAGISQRVPNQNLHGAYLDGASYIIITHKDLMQAANRLKEIRESGGPGNPNYLKTKIFNVDQIYNEFSGGVLDPAAIRDFIKYCYESWQEKPMHICLLGDGDIDFKNILVNHTMRIPPFENSDPFINEVNGYVTDDFYANVVDDSFERPDISIGRIPVNTLEESNGYIDKILCYEDPSTNGIWKTKAIFVADDGTTTAGPESAEHTNQCEELAENHTPLTFDKLKLYLVVYPAVITSQGRRKPGVNRDLIKYWNEGAIALNYTGHGSPDVWAHEYVFEKDIAISQLTNHCKYPFVTVASCDFSKFDNPLSISGGELLVIAPKRGAIGTLAATRPTVSSNNYILNNAFWSYLYIPRDTLLLQKRFGTALLSTKNGIGYGLNEKKFVLMGDPGARVQMARFISIIDSIAGLDFDTMKALSRIKIFGSVMKPDNSLWSDYSGKIHLKIFDTVRTVRMTDENGIPFLFNMPGSVIYSGWASVSNGKWNLEFIVPKDISYRNKHGKLINYFYNSSADGSGLDTSFIIGGINLNAPIDTTGPIISLFLNTRNFKSGDVVNPDFKLLADLFDESGINTTGTIGHKIEGIIDNNEKNKYDFTGFYNSDSSYKSGHLEYDFYGIAEGKHFLKLKAWDTYNNSSEAEIEFTVSSSSVLRVTNVYNYPNPFRDKTAFTFQHNYGGNINVSIRIYTVSGRLIKKIDMPGVTDKFVVINWAGTDEDGEKLANGVYLYKLTVTGDDGKTETAMGKLAVLK